LVGLVYCPWYWLEKKAEDQQQNIYLGRFKPPLMPIFRVNFFKKKLIEFMAKMILFLINLTAFFAYGQNPGYQEDLQALKEAIQKNFFQKTGKKTVIFFFPIFFYKKTAPQSCKVSFPG
jgi:hypothetical protein